MNRRLTILAYILLAIATAVVYSPVRRADFVNYDDENYVTQNAHVQAGLSWNTFTWAWRSTEWDNWQPLTWLSHALDCQLYGLNPVGQHFTNVLLHILNVLLLFLLLNRATAAPGRSLLVAALFAVHPLNVESVAWVAERKNVLSTLLFLLALGAYGRYATKPDLRRYWPVPALFMLGLAAKPMVITLPFVLLLLDYWPLRRTEKPSQPVRPHPQGRHKKLPRQTGPLLSSAALSPPPASWSRLVLEKAPLLILCVGSAIITVLAQKRGGAVRSLQDFSLWVRLQNALYAYAMYIWKAFWPTRLAVLYPHPGSSLTVLQLGLAAVFLAAVSLFVWKLRLTRPYLVTGWLWYLGTLVPVIGLVQVGQQAMADRYAYVPLIGLFVMLVWGVDDWLDSRKISLPARAGAAAVILIAFSILTWRQVGYWRDSDTLWSHALAMTENNLFAEESIGKSLVRAGHLQDALPHLEAVVRIDPRNPTRRTNLGSGLAQSGRYQDAVREYETAISLTSDSEVRIRCYETIALLYGLLGDYPRVRETYRQALQLDPAQASQIEQRLSQQAADENSGPAYLQLGLFLDETGKPSEARSAFAQALKLDPALDEAKRLPEIPERKQPQSKE
jgi:cytochrome c-type biogenesis protein CcmH/NrfG